MLRRALKTRILDHAELRLLEQGYRGMRVDELARDVGISKRTLYELFRTKEDMASEALERIFADLLVQIDRAIHEHPTDEGEQLRVIIGLLGDRFANARAPFHADVESTPALVERVTSARAQVDERLDAVLRAGIASGRFRADLDPHCVRLVLSATLDYLQRQGHERMSMVEACEGLYDMLARGLLVPG